MPVLCRNRFTLKSNSFSLINLRRNSASYIILLLFSLVWLKSIFPTPNFFFLIKSISFTLPYFDLISVWARFSDPKFFFQSTIYGLWLDDEYFLNLIFGPQFFFVSTIVTMHIIGEADLFFYPLFLIFSPISINFSLSYLNYGTRCIFFSPSRHCAKRHTFETVRGKGEAYIYSLRYSPPKSCSPSLWLICGDTIKDHERKVVTNRIVSEIHQIWKNLFTNEFSKRSSTVKKKNQRKKLNLYCKWCTSRLTLGFHFYQTITTWLEALLVNMSKLVLMFHGKFHCIKAINVRKKNIVQMRPLTAEIKNNN